MNNLALALGTFDGIHKGHQNVLSEAKQLASCKLTPAVLVFDRHPQEILSGKKHFLLITPTEKDRLFKENGILPVNVCFEEIKNYTPEEFVVFTKKLGAKALVCGENFHFGKFSSGNTEILFELCKKYDIILRIAKNEYCGDELISSSRIRACIENGETERANEMLGRYFSYDFPVGHGRGNGTVWGFPTANQKIPDTFVRLKFGVYASRVLIDGKFYPSVTNFGIRPTVSDSEEAVSETFVSNFDGSLYGKALRVELIKFLRCEQKFESVNALSAQVMNDSKKAVEIFNSLNIFNNERVD